MFKKSVITAAISLIAASTQAAEVPPSSEAMWQLIKEQQQQINTLKSQIQQTEHKVNVTADAVEQGHGQVAKMAEWAEKTTIGGYGEMHYNNLSNQLNGADDKDELDLHRFVLFFGHQFSDTVRMFSEVEIEHNIASSDAKGEVEVEQAYIEWDYAANQRAKAGVFLLPIGIMNETHEPDSFYGVERNLVEKNIIPATWWEGGLAFTGELAPGVNYDVAVTSGLYLEDGDYKIRDGRQKTSEAKSDDLAYTARLKYTAVKGLELAATLHYQTDLLQSEMHSSGASEVDAQLIELHAIYQTGPFAVRALYAQWDLDSAIELTQAGADEQTGWYLEPSYKVNDKLGVFIRVSEWDNQAGDTTDSEYQQIDIGLNYWLTEGVVLKADYQDQDVPTGKSEYDGFNLGVGWSF